MEWVEHVRSARTRGRGHGAKERHPPLPKPRKRDGTVPGVGVWASRVGLVLPQSTGCASSKTSVWRDRIACGLQCRRRPKGPERFEGDTARRLSFARANLSFARLHHAEVLFVDEKLFDSSDSDVYCYVHMNEEPIVRSTNRFPPRVHVFGMIGHGFRFLHMFEHGQSVTGDDYIKLCLAPNLRRLKRSWLVQDNAGPHKATEVQEWLAKHKIKILEFPARSPDMNVIEKCWSLVQQRVSSHGPLDVAQLRRFVRAEWDKISQTVEDSLCAGWSRSLEAVVRAKGETATK